MSNDRNAVSRAARGQSSTVPNRRLLFFEFAGSGRSNRSGKETLKGQIERRNAGREGRSRKRRHRPRHGPRHDQVRLMVRPELELVVSDRLELPPLAEGECSRVALARLEPKRTAASRTGCVEARPHEGGPDPVPNDAPVQVEPLEFNRVRSGDVRVRRPGPELGILVRLLLAARDRE